MVMSVSKVTPEVALLSFPEATEWFNDMFRVSMWDGANTDAYFSTMFTWRPNFLKNNRA